MLEYHAKLHYFKHYGSQLEGSELTRYLTEVWLFQLVCGGELQAETDSEGRDQEEDE